MIPTKPTVGANTSIWSGEYESHCPQILPYDQENLNPNAHSSFLILKQSICEEYFISVKKARIVWWIMTPLKLKNLTMREKLFPLQ